MVPFYGQGMNAGFEDVRVLFEHISAHPDNLALALSNYTRERKADAHTINDLAMRNYIEMRDNVTSRLYKFRKATEEILYAYTPFLGIRTLYSYVSFSNVRYSEVVQRVNWQQGVLNRMGGMLALGVMVGAATLVRRMMGGGTQTRAGKFLEMGSKGLGLLGTWLSL